MNAQQETAASDKLDTAAATARALLALAEYKAAKKSNLKNILISILIGACVAFFSTLFEGLAEFLKTHSTQVISGASASFAYIARTLRA